MGSRERRSCPINMYSVLHRRSSRDHVSMMLSSLVSWLCWGVRWWIWLVRWWVWRWVDCLARWLA